MADYFFTNTPGRGQLVNSIAKAFYEYAAASCSGGCKPDYIRSPVATATSVRRSDMECRPNQPASASTVQVRASVLDGPSGRSAPEDLRLLHVELGVGQDALIA